eukprot:Phypoly_transcript_12581.p1 GENE.Phypoly_transcript_12581~~Phypoly_transcript_12581.p1  ORF type:complete len:366 (+),score=130.52 Phypoly_transcript_12581:58-1098(+)
MKFMQRKREAELRAKLQEEQAKELKESHWVVGGSDELETVGTSGLSEVFTKVTSSTGRKSFGKFNREIEKLNQDIAIDNKKAMDEWISKNQPQQQKPQQNSSKPKKGNNLSWVRNVNKKAGVDGGMDEGTVSAADMAKRFLSIMEADGAVPEPATQAAKKKSKKEIKKTKKELNKKTEDESGKSEKSEESEGESEENEKSEKSEDNEESEESKESEESEGSEESEEREESDSEKEETEKSKEPKKDSQKVTTTSKPPQNKPQNKTTTPNNNNNNVTDKPATINKKGNRPNFNNNNNNNNKTNSQNNKNKNNNSNANNNANKKGQTKRGPQDANVAALEKQFKKPKI